MTTTLLDLKGKVWGKLNKSSSNPGIYTSAKLTDAIQEAVDFLTIEMNLADHGFYTQITHQTTVAGDMTAVLPTGLSVIKAVRYLVGDIYVPMGYDKGDGVAQYDSTSPARQVAAVYRIVNNQLYFNPALSDGGTNFLEIEGMYYPTRFVNDASVVDAQFDYGFQWYVVYKACSILAGTIEKGIRAWDKEEELWRSKIIELVKHRNLVSSTIREFGD